MYTALSATSLTLAEFLRQRLASDANLARFFDPAQGGTMVVSLNTPQQMTENGAQGLSLWLYWVLRDEQRANMPPERLGRNHLRRTPLPVRLHYLMMPTVDMETEASPETEQIILGKVLQAFHDYPRLRGTDLHGDFEGTTVELNIRLEPLGLEELTRVYDALDRSYQLSVSYEVSVVYIESEREAQDISPVEVVLPEYGLIAATESP